jgi:hypothetical protein
MISVASAISNAIYRSLGVRLNNLPMNPETVWAAVSEQRPDLLTKSMEEYSKLQTPMKARQ